MEIYKEYEGKLPDKIIEDVRSNSEDINEKKLKKILDRCVEEYEEARAMPGRFRYRKKK